MLEILIDNIREESKKEISIEIAIKLLKKDLPEKEIAEIVSLPVEEIEKLKDK